MRSKRACLLLSAILVLLLVPLSGGCSGTKACVLEVTVTGNTGSPIPGANVSSVNQPDGQLQLSGVTNQEGKVTFQAVKPGPYRIGVQYSDYTPRAMEFTLKNGQNFLAQFVISKEGSAPVIPTYESYGEENA